MKDLDAPFIGAFVDHFATVRGVSLATRNARLAVHLLFRYAAPRHSEHAGVIQRVLAIPAKRTGREHVCYLTGIETLAARRA